MDELQDVLDKDGLVTGKSKTKIQIFKDGDWRLVVHAWVICNDGSIIVQKRVSDKGIFDNLWDISMGGGVDAGETSRHACTRELEEELGLKVSEDELHYVGRYKIPKFIPEKKLNTNEHSDTFVLKKNINISDLVLQSSEVADAKTLSLDELLDQILDVEKSNNWVPHGQTYYVDVVAKIKEIF